MLALRLTLTGHASPGQTLVFDEVDAGIGGTAATAVGSALARLGDDAQVLVVTHLAQVAALASTQYVVDKTVQVGAGGGTTTVTARGWSRATSGSRDCRHAPGQACASALSGHVRAALPPL